jgi:hypothetical protein
VIGSPFAFSATRRPNSLNVIKRKGTASGRYLGVIAIGDLRYNTPEKMRCDQQRRHSTEGKCHARGLISALLSSKRERRRFINFDLIIHFLNERRLFFELILKGRQFPSVVPAR